MNADPPGDGPGEQGLDQLLGLLTASPTPDELAGETAAVSMYRATVRPPAAEQPRRQPSRPQRRVTPRIRLAVVAAMVAITGGFAMAAYAQALPAPMQHVAYRLLGFAVPAVSASFTGGPGGRSGLLTATSPLAAPGDTIVLEVRSARHWVIRRTRRFDASGKASFAVRRRAKKRAFRVVLLATARHGRSASNPVTVPRI